MFISAVNENIPKCTLNNVNDPPWMGYGASGTFAKENQAENKGDKVSIAK